MEKKKLLFIDACVRGECESRTFRLCSDFLEKVEDRYEIEHLNLTKEKLVPMDDEILRHRDELLGAGKKDDEFFTLGNDFIKADAIVIGAPFWDWAFPACLKAYIERISGDGITFRYEKDVCVGLAKAKKALYICTAGGYIGEKNLGAEYIKEVFSNFGIKEFQNINAEGLDIWGNDVEEILKTASCELTRVAKDF